MSTKDKIKRFAALMFVISMLCCTRVQDEIHARELRNLCKKVEIGMTEDQVVSIMGAPEGKNESEFRGRSKITYFYLSPFAVSTLTQVDFDEKSGTVIEARCGEE